ncbi:MAG: N-acetylglucosamine-6-phosphate deacetylase [Planctomycetaceae bacterium]
MQSGQSQSEWDGVINGTIVLPAGLIPGGLVLWEAGRLSYVGAERRVRPGLRLLDACGGYIGPGFVDLHVHGGAGADFMDATPEAVQCACSAHLRHGTTTIFPTTTTAGIDLLHEMIGACGVVMRQQRRDWGVSTIGGVHLYGPYFAADKSGCHDREYCRAPVAAEFEPYFESGLVKIATCAAELPGAVDFYRAARRRRCLVTCGHSNASWTEMRQAYRAGMRHVDHFWCAMSSVPSIRQRLGTPMQGSMAEFVLMEREMSTEVIADGCHLSPELLEFAVRMKGPDRLCLVTDCNRALDMPAGDYVFVNRQSGTLFSSDGLVGRAAGGGLASAIVGMDHMVRQMYSDTTADLPAVFRMASLTPAERAGVQRKVGSLEAGKRADVLLLNRRLKIESVVLGGQLRHQAD